MLVFICLKNFLHKIFPNGYNQTSILKRFRVKEVVWMGRSRSDLREFPDRVRRAVGHALHKVQEGDTPSNARVFHGFGSAKVSEIREDDPSGTYRAVYTVEFRNLLVILHCFQKKSKRGIATPKPDMEQIQRRLKEARGLYR